nr:MAG TPA: hypothetical protein [Caudoviricetes sp.]
MHGFFYFSWIETKYQYFHKFLKLYTKIHKKYLQSVNGLL